MATFTVWLHLQLGKPDISSKFVKAVSIKRLKTMEHSYKHLPPPILKHMVQSFWQAERSNPIPATETIFPKGQVEIIFNLHNEPMHSEVGGIVYTLPRCFINGYNTRCVTQQLLHHQTFFGIVLHASAIRHLFRINADDFVDCCTDMTMVDPTIDSLWHQLAEQPTFTERVQLVSVFLTKRIIHTNAHEQAFDRFINSFEHSTLSVNRVADLLCYSPRQLSRKLRTLTGLNTEETLLYKKYLHALELIHHTPLSLTQIAYTCQFADQSHFNKTFKSFTETTPGEYRRRKSDIVGHLFENVR